MRLSLRPWGSSANGDRKVRRLRRAASLAVAAVFPVMIMLPAAGSVASATQGRVPATVRPALSNDPVVCSGPKPTVYMVGSVANSTFWQAIENGFVQGGQDFCVHAIYSAPNAHTSTDEIGLLQAALATHPSGIAVNYVDHTIYNITLKILAAHVNIVMFNNNRFEPVNGVASTATTNPAVTSIPYIGQDEDKSGAVLATAFLPYIPKGKTVLWFPVVPGVEVITLRGDGLASVLKANHIPMQFLEAPGAPGNEGLDETQDEAVVCSYLKGHPEIGAVMATSATAPGTALCEQRDHLHIPIAEFDVDLQSADFIKDGYIKVALDQQPFWQGYLAAEDLAFEARFKLTPVSVNSGTEIVTAANVNNVIYAINHGKD
jgi:simple sugar transport system substrate-binding protein